MVQKYPTGQGNAEDICQRVIYRWDALPPGTGFTASNTTGRLAEVQYGSSGTSGTPCVPGGTPLQYTEMYSYHPAGALAAKQLQVTRVAPVPFYDPDTGGIVYEPVPGAGTLNAAWTYNTEGRVSSVTYPVSMIDPNWQGICCVSSGGMRVPAPGPITFTYGFDNMGRPSSMTDNYATSMIMYDLAVGANVPFDTTWVQNMQYDYAGRMSSLQYLKSISDSGYDYAGDEPSVSDSYTTETMSYNVNGQLASLNFSGGVTGGIQYIYSATQNNGQITRAVDTISGETISYQYDALKRLTSASSTGSWTQSYQYDGFGNLTGKTLNGTLSSIAVNEATNRLTNAIYDANGNMTSGAGATLAYDEANRMKTAQEVSGGVEYYGYAPDNKQVYRMLPNGNEEFTFYGAHGEKLGVFREGLLTRIQACLRLRGCGRMYILRGR
jgi:YD repeat-containing protein